MKISKISKKFLRLLAGFIVIFTPKICFEILKIIFGCLNWPNSVIVKNRLH